MFDLTSQESFNNVEKWISNARTVSSMSVYFCVQTCICICECVCV